MGKITYSFENMTLQSFVERFNAFAKADRNIKANIYKSGSGAIVTISKKPMMRDSFNPEFAGKAEQDGSGVRLSGTLGIPKWVKGFCIFFLICFLSMFLVILLAGLFDPENLSVSSNFIDLGSENGGVIFNIIYGIFIVLFAVLFFLIATVFQRRNREYIMGFIEKLGGKLEDK